MGLWTYLCYLISVVLDCGLCFGFWFLCVLFGWFLMGMGWLWVLCSLGWFLMGMGCFDFSILWLILMCLGWFWFLMDLGFDFSVIWVWVLNFSDHYVGHLSAIILHDQSRFNISYLSSFKDIFCQWDPKYYVYLLMPNKVSLEAIPVNWLKNFEGQLVNTFFLFFFFIRYLLLQKEVRFFALLYIYKFIDCLC